MRRIPAIIATTCLGTLLAAASARADWRFDFGTDPAAPGWTRVGPDTLHAGGPGFGFEPAAGLKAIARNPAAGPTGDFITAEAPFSFSVDAPEGNYRITVHLGDPEGESVTTIKAEARRLMVREHRTAAGRVEPVVFCVNTRTPDLPDGGRVTLNSREEVHHRNWDRTLTLEFLGDRPCVAAIEITPATDVTTLYLAGDSTVTDQTLEPWSAWGQMLPSLFNERVSVANHAESGRTLDSFRNQARLQKILRSIQAGDYLFIQFGHNDMKQKGEGLGAFLNFQDNLREYVQAAREREAIPVLLTPMHRRRFDAQGRIVDTHEEYPTAIRQVAAALDVPLIDLHRESRILFEALGVEGSRRAFVHYPANAFPGQQEALKDDSHFSPYGAYQLARIVAEGVRAANLDLARHLTVDGPSYDPAHPPPFETWRLPASPVQPLQSPEGS